MKRDGTVCKKFHIPYLRKKPGETIFDGIILKALYSKILHTNATNVHRRLR